MKRYAVTAPSTSGSGPNTAINVIGSTAIRPAIYDIILGSTSTPADQEYEFRCGRTTAAGTAGSNPTPLALDSGDVAAVCTAGITHSAEPTYAATSFLDFAVNLRATQRWVATPGGELIGSAVASNGVGLKNHASSAALVVNATCHWTE